MQGIKKRTRFAERWNGLFSKRSVRLIVQALLGIPPFLVGLIRFSPTIKSAEITWLQETLSSHTWLFFLCMITPALWLALNEITAWSKEHLSGQVVTNPDLLFDTLSAIDRVVGEKNERFKCHAEQLQRQNGVLACRIFDSITQPEEQYKALIKALWGFFTNWFNDKGMKIQVILASMGQRHIEEFVFTWPPDHPPNVSASELRFKDCAFSKAKSGKMIIISDVAAEAKKPNNKRSFHPIKGQEAIGSLLCFPLRLPGVTGAAKVPLVISVHTDKPRRFNEKEREQWDWLLSRFEQRFVLEYNLAKLKSIGRTADTCSKTTGEGENA